MRRLILETAPDAAGRFRLEGRDFRYLSKVLRLGPGSTFRVLLPGGAEALARVLEADARSLGAIVETPALPGSGAELPADAAADLARRGVVAARPPFVLIQALPKAAKMDDIVRQATELGVDLILPFIADRSVSRPEAGGAKRERWLRIVREARQQSGSDVATDVRSPLSLPEALGAWEDFSRERGGGLGIFLHQDPLAQGSLHGYLSRDPGAVALAVGPEGGFSDGETAAFGAAGFLPALLGANVLRVETAAVAALAASMAIVLEKTSWIPKRPGFPASSG